MLGLPYRLPYALVQWVLSFLLFAVLIIIAIPAVPLGMRYGFDGIFWLWGNEDEPGKGTWWNQLKWYWRNPVANFRKRVKEPDNVKTYGATDSMDEVPGLQIRYKHSAWLDSFRLSYGKPRKGKGKKDVYVGWKIDSITPGVGFAFTVRWYGWLLIGIGTWLIT